MITNSSAVNFNFIMVGASSGNDCGNISIGEVVSVASTSMDGMNAQYNYSF